jgi:hypothetical protein
MKGRSIMQTIKKVFGRLLHRNMPNIGLVIFSLLFLYFVVAFSGLRNHPDDYKVIIWSIQGAVCSCGAILVWVDRWRRLDKNYRHIAIFFWIVFGYFLLQNLQILFSLAI